MLSRPVSKASLSPSTFAMELESRGQRPAPAFTVFKGEAWGVFPASFLEHVVFSEDGAARQLLAYFANFKSSPEHYLHTGGSTLSCINLSVHFRPSDLCVQFATVASWERCLLSPATYHDRLMGAVSLDLALQSSVSLAGPSLSSTTTCDSSTGAAVANSTRGSSQSRTQHESCWATARAPREGRAGRGRCSRARSTASGRVSPLSKETLVVCNICPQAHAATARKLIRSIPQASATLWRPRSRQRREPR